MLLEDAAMRIYGHGRTFVRSARVNPGTDICERLNRKFEIFIPDSRGRKIPRRILNGKPQSTRNQFHSNTTRKNSTNIRQILFNYFHNTQPFSKNSSHTSINGSKKAHNPLIHKDISTTIRSRTILKRPIFLRKPLPTTQHRISQNPHSHLSQNNPPRINHNSSISVYTKHEMGV